MAQFDFLGTWTDSWAILASILETTGTFFVADAKYEQPEPLFLRTVDEIRAECLKGNYGRFYVASDAFSVWQPCFRQTSLGWYVSDRRGGPLLELVLPSCYVYDNVGQPMQAFSGGKELHLACGTLMHQPAYHNPANGMWEPPSAALKAGYKEVLRRMKAQLVRHRFHEPIWTGRDALHEIENGNATIHGFGLD